MLIIDILISPLCYQKYKVKLTVYLLLIYLQLVIHETFNCRVENRVQISEKQGNKNVRKRLADFKSRTSAFKEAMCFFPDKPKTLKLSLKSNSSTSEHFFFSG